MRQLKPDLIYALLNWQTVPWAQHVLQENPGVPFIWHFKEGPFIDKGLWPALVDLFTRSDGQIYASPELRDWFALALPGGGSPATSLVLDGDLPKRDWLTDARQPRLSEADGEPHTVVLGRPVGFDPEAIGAVTAAGVHLHFYGNFLQPVARPWAAAAQAAGGRYMHLHAAVCQAGWVEEFSRYDAGWLHRFTSQNGGELRRAHWEDLNYPNRIGTLLAAGVPLLQQDNTGAIVATQTLARSRDLGIFVHDAADLRAHLDDRSRMTRLRENAWRQRDTFTFDHHADTLVAFFHRIIAGHTRRQR